MKRISFIAITASILLSVAFVSSICARTDSDEGGFIFSYPQTEKPTRSPSSDAIPSIPVSSRDRILQTEIAPETLIISDVDAHKKNQIIARLKKQMQLKDKHIAVLEQRVERLSASLEKNESQLYMMRPQEGQRYHVKKGDSLWKIAARKDTYGNPYMWITIYNANMSKIEDPNLIFAGQLFDIPK